MKSNGPVFFLVAHRRRFFFRNFGAWTQKSEVSATSFWLVPKFVFFELVFFPWEMFGRCLEVLKFTRITTSPNCFLGFPCCSPPKKTRIKSSFPSSKLAQLIYSKKKYILKIYPKLSSTFQVIQFVTFWFLSWRGTIRLLIEGSRELTSLTIP